MTKTAALLGVILIATACAGVSQSNMHTTDSGLQYIDHVVGDGAEAATGQTVEVHYTGWL